MAELAVPSEEQPETSSQSVSAYQEHAVDVGALEDVDSARSKKGKRALETKLIQDGLRLSLKGQKEAFVSFTYAISPLMETPVRVDWKILTAEGIECQHIRFHQLQQSDDLNELATKYKKSLAVAMILVNSQDNYELAECLYQGVLRSKKPILPAIVITLEDGKKVKEYLARHDPGELHARFESKKQSHIEPTEGTPSPSQQPKFKRHGGIGAGIRRSMRPRGKRSGVNLKEEVKQLMFPISGPVCVSKDERVFKDVMMIFYNFEETMQKEPHSCDGAAFRKLSKHLDEMFASDFPFYLLLAYRIYKKQHLYQCDELNPFIRSCIDKFEKLDQVSVSRTLETFLKMDNFKVMFDQSNANMTVFHLLEYACIELMKHSFIIKGQEGNQLDHHFVYNRMHWISVAFKFHVERGAGPREAVDYWKDNLTCNQTHLQLNSDIIHSIKRGVEFSRMLQLPDSVAFNSDHMADILTAEGAVRPFKQIREFVIVLEPYVTWENTFVLDFLTKPRACYQPYFEQDDKEKLKVIQHDGNLLAILQDGLAFLDTILEAAQKRHWQSAELDDEMKKWLSMLLYQVDMSTDNAESYLKDFLSSKPGTVTKQYSEHIKREVRTKLEDCFNRLTVEQFLKLYKAFYIWPNWVVEKYLKQYKIPVGVRVCSPTWIDFYGVFVERFTDAQHHKFLLEFIKTVAICYKDQDRAKDFILDLLHLDVPGLFVTDTEGSTSTLQSDILASSVPDEFSNFLADYIQRNNLQETILGEVEAIWGLISDHSDFQQLILQVLQQELIPESLALHGPLTPPLKFLLDKCVTTICKELDSVRELPSKLEFCWGVVGSCCTKMPLSNNLEWVNSYYTVIDQLGRIYGVYCSQQQMQDTKSILDDESMPADVSESSCEGVKVFFEWVSKAQQTLDSWRQKFQNRHINYDEIQLYTTIFSQLNRVATALSAESLVVDIQFVQGLKQDLLQAFEMLNILLLRYIPGQPEAGWCALQHMLSKYGVALPGEILLTLKQHITFPGESKSSGKKDLMLNHPIECSVSNTFCPNQDIQLEITRELTMDRLKSLVRDIDDFLNPVQPYIDLLTFFFLRDSEIFDKYLKLQLSKQEEKQKPVRKVSPAPLFVLPTVVIETKPAEITKGVSIILLGEVLKVTKELLLKLMKGTASYTDITADGTLTLKSLDIDQEFSILNQYAENDHINITDAEGLKGVKAMLELFQYTRHIQVIHSICEQFQLKKCLEDPNLRELVTLVDVLDQKSDHETLTAKDAIEKMKKVTKILHLGSGSNGRFLELFSAVADSADFYHFIVNEKQFVGPNGQALFQQQYQLLTTHLQHEEYNEVVLNHLFAAFKLIIPFTNREVNFKTLMSEVSGLNAYDGRRQLETVNRNINLIRLWFSRAEGDTLQGMSAELRCVMDSGYYQFIFPSSDSVKAVIELVYVPHTTRYQNIGEVRDEPSLPTKIKLNEEQICDFVRKLGFMDVEGDSQYLNNHFLHLNQTANKLVEYYSKLRELGHPDYLDSVVMYSLQCSSTQDEADEMVNEASRSVTGWEEQMADLRSEYEQLLYFSVPKLLHLYQNLTAPDPSPESIMHNVGFLFENSPSVQAQLKQTVQKLLPNKVDFIEGDPGEDTPMHVVGAFLSALYENFELSTHSLTLKRCRAPSMASKALSNQSTHILHSCQGFSQSQLIRLIISVYGGVPEPFEVLHCQPSTTEEELRLFLSPKRATKRPFQYLILEVNKLPYQLQEALIRIHFELRKQQITVEMEVPCVHFVETSSSLLQEMPSLIHRDYNGAEPSLDFQQAVLACQRTALNPDDFCCIQLVYGNAGDGKTHYIQSQLKRCLTSLKISVNEVFTPLSAIKKLCTLPTDTPECAVFFNFTMLPPGDNTDDSERELYAKMIETIGWFFFDLFILGYVEDPLTGWSFRFPGGMQLAVYIEVPSRDHMTAEMSLKEFFEDVPALGLIGTPHMVYPTSPFDVDRDVQLVCKYLKQYKIGGSKGIDRLYKESRFHSKKTPPPVKFSLDDDLPDDQCRYLLDHFTPPHMKKNKALQTLFVKYMKRRCAFLDNCPGFNYNSGSSDYLTNDQGKREKNDTTQLGSTLMDTMIKEVGDFCDPFIRENWAMKPHHQLIYDFKDGGGTFGLMSLHPDKISDEDRKRFKKIGVQMPSMFELYSRDWLDLYLSRALGVPLDPVKKRITLVDESNYILTLDFALKMLNIHERAECGVPVIIEGETGVGKTFLIDMLSKLWNYSLYKHWSLYTDRMMDFIKSAAAKLPSTTLKSSEDIIANINKGDVREDDLLTLGELQLDDGRQLYTVMRERILEMAGDPILSLLELREEDRSQDNLSMTMLVAAARFKNNVKDTARVVYKFLNARVKTMFYKLNVHAALQPSDITSFFEPIFEQAKDLRKAYSRFSTQTRVPFITVFLDEINTSSCLGLFKEVMVDKTLDGKSIQKNIFIIGACNPHRGNSLASLGNSDTWIRGTYCVRPLHPTLQCLMWDYGALGEQQERDYIHAKMKIFNKGIANADIANLTDLIVLSQNLMRKFALDQLKKNGFSESDAHACSRSCVSQRDIQRVFTFYEWLMKMYKKFKPHGKFVDYPTRAIVVSLGLVYFIRLDSSHRKMYEDELNHKATPTRVSFSKCFDEELKWYINKIDLPLGIAKTTALKENLFASIVCTMTHTPLIIVGSPGSSKTLSFNLTLANLKGQESKVTEFRKTEIFKALDPQFYQCSRRTTSNEIQTVFSRAINRQRSHQRVPLPVYCVVFMDEAGLPEERHESLKVLHYYLDSQEVSFVAISNHILDAAKTNRAVSLFRPEAPRKDLDTLARGCLCHTPENPPPELKKDMDMVASFCPAYEALMKNPRFSSFFGLRDFINFISYLRRKRMEMLSPQLVMEALERNFNGVCRDDFSYISKLFLKVIHSNPNQVEARNILAILDSCMKDHPQETGAENEMRYKLIIDSSEDNSVVRLLFSTGVLKRDKTRMYMCSDFHGDSQLQKVNTIAAVRHSATEGHTVVMCQTDSIHESFYDLFNRRFHRIDANTGPRYYANIAIGAHIKPCRVHPDFECIVVVKQSELKNKNIPAPFLNRFEKYLLSHELILEAALENLPPALSIVLKTVLNKVNDFLDTIGREASIYGLQKDTLSSLLLTMLPHVEFEYKKYLQQPLIRTSVFDIKTRIVEILLQALRENAGFQLPTCSVEEMQLDAKEVMEHVLRDSEFAGQVLRMSTESSSTETIYMAATEALEALYTIRSIKEVPKEVSANACLMISVMTQWLVRHLCKRLMQLMTSEALCLHHRKVPTSFIKAYLNHQHHFSLKSLLESQTKILKSAVHYNANKLVCFTRSSQDLHQLPSQFPNSFVESSAGADSSSILKELVYSDTTQLVVQKLSTMTTFTNVSNLLRTFAENPTQKTVLVVVNMQETTRDVVNHLRIMIEEAESQSSDKKKLYALLLHFPSSKVITHCYPAMFVQGWDFHYLDILGCSPKGVIIDIRDWFKQCCNSSSSSDCSLVTQLSSLLHEAISFIASHMFFGSHIKSTFNRPMSLPERISSLEKLFFEKGVGEILCERFNSYWQPSVMVDYLEKAAVLAQQQETSLSVIDSLQTIFKNLFFDFLVYMVYKMNERMNIDVVFNPDCTPEIYDLFLKVLKVYPIPKLSELKMLLIADDSSNFTMCDVNFSPPKFPFFNLVSSFVEKLVDQSRRDFSENVNMLGESVDPSSSLLQTPEQRRLKTMVEVIQIVQDKLEDCAQSKEETVVSVAVKAMKSIDGLWQNYLEDFTHQKLRLEFGNSGISQKVLRAAFGKLEERSAVQRVAVLHVYIHLHKLNLAKIVSILRPLDQIEKAKAVLPSLTERISSPSHILNDIESRGSFLGCPETLSSFIINTLFSAIAGISMNCTTPDDPKLQEAEEQQIMLWFKAYKDVMSMTSLKEHIYISHSKTTDAQHSLMHILFLVIRSNPSHCTHNLQCGMKLFNKLLVEFFTMELELLSKCPRLDSLIYAVAEELVVVNQTTEKDQMRHILEGVLAHFFSVHRSSYDDDDIKLFLKIANRQEKWLATYGMDEVIEVEFSDDLLDITSSLTSMLESPLQKLGSYIPLSVYKMYLHQILMSNLKQCDESAKCVMLFFHKTKVHTMISQVLREDLPDSDPAPYIPTFYQFSDFIEHNPAADEALMQQPLTHLYFFTILENVASLNFGLSGLITTSQKISKCQHWFEGHSCPCCCQQCRGGSVAKDELVLLHIEEQAVVQVIIRDVAKYLDITDNSKINALGSVLPDLNTILDDLWMGGGSAKGHGLALAMHILKEQQSFNKFLHLFTSQYDMLLNGINCLQPFHQTLSKMQPLQPGRDQACTVLLDIGSEFQILYSRVCNALNAIHNSHGASSKVKDLTRIAEESGKLNIVTPSGKNASMSKSACFKMALFLVIYNEFFIKNKSSQYLAQVVANDSFARRLGSHCVRLLLCFVESKHMIKCSSSDDPLIKLFCPFSTGNEAQSDADLRVSLAHMIAVTLGCQPQSTHLWYNMFTPDELVNTFLTGFMYDTPVGPDTKFYDSGVKLSSEGFFGRHDYIQHATRGTLNIQSLYLVLWSNFCGFSIALLSQPDAELKLAGKLISEEESIRQYCVSQMFKMWNLLKEGLNISEEERRLLVRGCLNNLLEHDLLSSSPICGKLHTCAELDNYEKTWHNQIFLPQWNSLKQDSAKLNEVTQLPVMKSIMHLNSRYPWFPDVNDLSIAVLSRTDIAEPSCPLYPLSQFVLQYPRLRMGIDLLPSIVELYQWLHTELTYAVTYDDAASITLERVSKVAAKHLSDHSTANYDKFKMAFNSYIQLTGCTNLKHPCCISDDTPLLHLLSYSTESESGNDLLYTVISDVIKFLNMFVVTLLENLSNSAIWESYCPESVPKVHVMEFTQHYILAGESNSHGDLSSLINGHCHLPLPAKREGTNESAYSHLPAQLSTLIDTLKLQEDVVEFCIAGMPLIDNSSISSLRIPFIFKEDRSRPSLHVTLRDHAMDLEGVAAKLSDKFKVSLDDAFRKQLEYEFHSASYHGIMEVISGLRTTTGHLIKELSLQASERLELLELQTLPDFLVELYEYDPLDDSRDVFHEIGIYSLSQAQHVCLESLTLNSLFQTLHLFVRWAEEGWYDFCSLPFAAKMQMSLPDEDLMRLIPEEYEGSPEDLLKELRSLVDLLVHLEPSIVRTLTEKPQRSITKYLKKLQVCDIESKLLSSIPDGVLLEHYVSLRLFLRRLISHMQSIVRQDVTAPEPQESIKWCDFIDDLWDRKLPHFRRKGYVYSSNPSSPEPSSAEEGPQTSKVVNELINYSSETNLMELADEVAPVLESVPPQVPNTPEYEIKKASAYTSPNEFKKPDQSELELAKQFSVKDVVKFLHQVKLGQYAIIFEEFEINGEILVQLPDNELQDMGIASALDRLKISSYFHRYIAGDKDIPNQQSVKIVVKFLDDIKPLKQFASKFGENNVDSQLLLDASDDVMRELGVDTGVHIRLIRTKFKNFPHVIC